MASAFTLSTASRDAMCNALVDAIDVGGAGKIKIYDGTPPANPAGSPPNVNPLAVLVFGATAFGASSTGAAGNNAIANVTAAVSGTATYFRVTKSDDTVLFQGSAGASGCDMTLTNSAVILANGTISCANGAFTLTVAETQT